jgi:ligand-binding sensor domain-containing protein
MSPVVKSVLYDKAGSLWVSLVSKGMVRISKNGSQLEMTESNSGLHGNTVLYMSVDENNKKWFITNSGAIVGFKEAPIPSDKEVINKMNSDYEEGFIVDAVQYNNIWYLVHDNLGLCSLEGDVFKVITPKGDRGFHYGVSVSKTGKVYMATNKYLHTWDGSTYEKMTIDDDGITKQINDVLIDRNDNIWIAHNKGVARGNGSSWELFTKKGGQLSSGSNENLFEDSKGNIWIDGSTRFDGSGWTSYSKKNGGFNVDGEMAETPDGKFVTSNGWVLYEFDGTTWSQRKDFERITGGINNLLVTKEGDFWVSTNERGLVKSSKGVSTFCDASNCGLYDNHVSYAFGNEDGMWISNGKKPAPPTSPSMMGQPGQPAKTPPAPTEKEIFESKLMNFEPMHALMRIKSL